MPVTIGDFAQDGDRSRRHLGTDAIAGKDGDICSHAALSMAYGFRRVLLLPGADLGLGIEQEAELVDAIEQAMPGESIELEADHAPLAWVIVPAAISMTQLAARAFQQFAVLGLGDDDGQQPVLQRVAAEDVGDFRRDDRLDAVVEQGPGRVLAR